MSGPKVMPELVFGPAHMPPRNVREEAIGILSLGKVQALEAAGLTIVDAFDRAEVECRSRPAPPRQHATQVATIDKVVEQISAFVAESVGRAGGGQPSNLRGLVHRVVVRAVYSGGLPPEEAREVEQWCWYHLMLRHNGRSCTLVEFASLGTEALTKPRAARRGR